MKRIREQGPPTGVVTFLFSDIEGSTWLLQHLGEAYDDVLEKHRELLRTAWIDNDGYEFGTGGDSFYVAFDEPSKAVHAAADGQRALVRHTWSEGAPIRVRMGIHTGDARRREGDYVGLAVHQAARIASAAHGGQVIVSDATVSEITTSLDGIEFADLGLHRLKDLAHPVRLFQIAHGDLPATFPPPRTLTGMPHNLPVQATPFIGREDDVAGLAQTLASGRVVTITAAGGAGKTRLALQVAADVIGDFADGAWLVDLAPIAEPELVASAIADVLGVREQPGREIIDTLTDALIGKQLLIVLDNCEHLIESSAALVHRLVAACPTIKVLATSREALNIPAEAAWRLRSLSLPREEDVDVESATAFEGIALFLQRAAAVRPDFALDTHSTAPVVQICRRLDGLPLAIELAAARVRSMSVHEIAAHLDDRFRLLTGGSRVALPRQRTLEAAVSWSYDSLPELDKVLFERLSVFAGGCGLAAAEQVCAGDDIEVSAVMDTLDHLVARSLLATEDSAVGDTRYKLLETLRQFGRERLIGRGCAEAVRTRHVAWAVALAERLPQQTGAAPAAEAVAEEDNFRAAIQWASETGDSAAALRISGSVWVGHFDERKRLYERLLPPGPEIPADVAGKALFAGGGLAFMMGEWALGVERMHAAVGANAAAGNRALMALSLVYEGVCVWGLGDITEAGGLVDAAFAEARSIGDIGTQARALVARGWLETERNLDGAKSTALEGIALGRTLSDVFELGHCQELLGFVCCMQGDHSGGAVVLADAADTFHQIQHNCAAHVLETAAAWAAMTGGFALGAELWGAAERIRHETRDKPRPWERAVQEVWLPTISAALSPDELGRARDRGRRLGAEEALEFAAKALRAGYSADDPTQG